MTPALHAGHVVEAARRGAEATRPSQMPDELSDFGGDAGDDPALDMLEEMDAPVDDRIDAALARGDEESLHLARNLLPRRLSDHDRQGATLFTMAEVEKRLGQPALARGYLEAAAREFADRFDLPRLEEAAALALELIGRDAFAGSPVHVLLDASRARLRPIESPFDARSFVGLDARTRDQLAAHVSLRTLAPGDTLVTEGEPSRNLFVVKSGLVGVWLEKPSGGSWLVRCCFPGWLLGESSVLANDARCTASLRAERVSEVWILPAAAARAVMDADPSFSARIAATKQMHRIDSFFSMHETMSQLDVQVRDDVLSCIRRLETFDADTVLVPANEIPESAFLVARGAIALFEGERRDAPVLVVEPDGFYGVRDAIHRIAPALTAVARAGTTVAFFDAGHLQELCERSPEQVVAVLERLG
jgi:CRP-like cAMP-binding protein